MKKQIEILNREMTKTEMKQMYAGFDQHTLDQNVQIQDLTRHSYTALFGNKFIGCSSGLAYKNGDAHSGWFYLTDLKSSCLKRFSFKQLF